jgi:hypothetical protein
MIERRRHAPARPAAAGAGPVQDAYSPLNTTRTFTVVPAARAGLRGVTRHTNRPKAQPTTSNTHEHTQAPRTARCTHTRCTSTAQGGTHNNFPRMRRLLQTRSRPHAPARAIAGKSTSDSGSIMRLSPMNSDVASCTRTRGVLPPRDADAANRSINHIKQRTNHRDARHVREHVLHIRHVAPAGHLRPPVPPRALQAQAQQPYRHLFYAAVWQRQRQLPPHTHTHKHTHRQTDTHKHIDTHTHTHRHTSAVLVCWGARNLHCAACVCVRRAHVRHTNPDIYTAHFLLFLFKCAPPVARERHQRQRRRRLALGGTRHRAQSRECLRTQKTRRDHCGASGLGV